MYRFVHDVKKLHACEEVKTKQEVKILALEDLVKTSEGIAINLTQQLDNQKLISGTLSSQLEETIKFYKEESKHFKKKYIKTAIVAVLEAALIILIIVHG